MEILDDLKAIQKCDPANMAGLIYRFADQMKEAEQIGASLQLVPELGAGISHIVFSGLGGSAIGADFVRSYLNYELAVPVMVNRHYRLPAFVNEKTLLILSSYSGDTEEVLASLKEGLRRRSRLLAISSGGELSRLAQRHSIPLIRIPGGLPPRAALGYSVIPLVMALSKIGFPKAHRPEELKEAGALLQTLSDAQYGVSVPFEKNRAKQFAKHIFERHPVVYASTDHFDVVALRWRGQMEENAKTLSSHHVFPEMTHNELVGWGHPEKLLKQCIVFLLRDAGDHPRVQVRMDVTADLIGPSGAQVIHVFSEGEGLLARMFSLIHLGDWVSFYLAVLYETDPTPVKVIQQLKAKLAKETV